MEHDFSGLHKADLLQGVVEDFKLLDGQVSVHFYDYFPHSYAGGRAADRGNHVVLAIDPTKPESYVTVVTPHGPGPSLPTQCKSWNDRDTA